MVPICVINVIIVELTVMIRKNGVVVCQKSCKLFRTLWRCRQSNILASVFWPPCTASPFFRPELCRWPWWKFTTLSRPSSQLVSAFACTRLTHVLGFLVFTAFVTSFAPAMTPGEPVHALKSVKQRQIKLLPHVPFLSEQKEGASGSGHFLFECTKVHTFKAKFSQKHKLIVSFGGFAPCQLL